MEQHSPDRSVFTHAAHAAPAEDRNHYIFVQVPNIEVTLPWIEQHKPKGRMLFRLGNVTYLLPLATHCHTLYHLHPFHCMFKDLVAKQQSTNVYTATNTCYSLSIHTSLPSVSCALQATKTVT